MPPDSPGSAASAGRARPSWARLALVAAVVVSVATALGATIAVGRAPQPPSTALDSALFKRVVADPAALTAFEAPAPATAPDVVEAIPDFRALERTFEPRPQPELQQAVGVVVKPAPRSRAQTASGGGGGGGSGNGRATGTASWYCKAGVSVCHYQYPGGLYAAAGPALRVGNWRGRSVTVCGGGGCVNVRLIDWCACPRRVIDLYSDAFRQLAPLSQGTMRVTVTW